MNPDLAYFIGMLIGGGAIAPNRSFVIEYPYKKWINDIGVSFATYQQAVTQLRPLVEDLVGVTIVPNLRQTGTYPTMLLQSQGRAPSIFIDLLESYGLPSQGRLRDNANLSIVILVQYMGANMLAKQQFIRGLADVIGSCQESQRAFTGVTPIISFELRNWHLPMEVCHLLHEQGIAVDQILWEHPNIQSGKDPTYDWRNKGFKLRVRATDFAQIGYRMTAKQNALNALLQGVPLRRREFCEDPNRKFGFRVRDVKVRHQDENSSDLPPAVRGHFIHFTHICAALGCPYAPLNRLRQAIQNYNPQNDPNAGNPRPV